MFLHSDAFAQCTQNSLPPPNLIRPSISFKTQFDGFFSRIRGFPRGSVVKNLPANAGDSGDTGSIPGSGRCPGLENGNLLQYSCLENPMEQKRLVSCSPWNHRVRHNWACMHSGITFHSSQGRASHPLLYNFPHNFVWYLSPYLYDAFSLTFSSWDVGLIFVCGGP